MVVQPAKQAAPKTRDVTPTQRRAGVLVQGLKGLKGPAAEIIRHLADSGTGTAKLSLLCKLAKEAESLKEFLYSVGQEDSLNEGTLLKIETFIGQKDAEKHTAHDATLAGVGSKTLQSMSEDEIAEAAASGPSAVGALAGVKAEANALKGPDTDNTTHTEQTATKDKAENRKTSPPERSKQ